MKAVSKRFGQTVALDGVDLSIAPGEVHGIIGENGAGKSTLMNVLCGVLRPDSGSIEFEGTPFRARNPAEATRRGLAMIHQEPTLAAHLSAEANVLLGLEATRLGFLRGGVNRSRATAALARLERTDIDLDVPVGSLGIGEQQLVEIARALTMKAKLLVMDEPTSSLSAEDKRHLFGAIRRLKLDGVSVIYISHFLEEVKEICDRFTVLRDGRVVASGDVIDVSRGDLVRLMVGREVDEAFAREDRAPGPPIVRVSNLRGRSMPRGVDFELRRGEILGLAGLVGAGRTETLRALFGLDPIVAGNVSVIEAGGAESFMRGSVGGRVARGIGMVSEDRKNEGLATGLSVADNMLLSASGSVSRFGFLDGSRVRSAARRWIDELHIRSAEPNLPVAQLSGGNQQKVAVARLLQMDADVFLLDEPTRGIDIGSKIEIYRLMDRLAREGKAILFVSSYLPELLGVCDRIGVMARGRIVETRSARDWNEHEIMESALTKEAEGEPGRSAPR